METNNENVWLKSPLLIFILSFSCLSLFFFLTCFLIGSFERNTFKEIANTTLLTSGLFSAYITFAIYLESVKVKNLLPKILRRIIFLVLFVTCFYTCTFIPLLQ